MSPDTTVAPLQPTLLSLDAARQMLGGMSLSVLKLYLDCAGAELIRRYDETRRRHPLALDRPAEDGIARDRVFIIGAGWC